MKLATIIDAVLADLATVQAGVTSKIGARYAASNVELVPRLVWVPTGETFEAPWNMSENPRQFYSRMARVLVHIQGGDPDRTGDLGPTELLMHRLIGALYRVGHGYVTIGAGQWPSEDGSTSTSGPLYLLEVTFAIPVTDETVDSVVVTSVEQGAIVALPSGDETEIPLTP